MPGISEGRSASEHAEGFHTTMSGQHSNCFRFAHSLGEGFIPCLQWILRLVCPILLMDTRYLEFFFFAFYQMPRVIEQRSPHLPSSHVLPQEMNRSAGIVRYAEMSFLQ